MKTETLTNNDKLQAQIDEWLECNEFESRMAKLPLVEYMRMYDETLVGDADVLLEFYRQCPRPEKFWLEICVGGTRHGVQIASHVFSAEPSATYDKALATFKDALAFVKSLGWENIEPTLKWAKADNDTSCANGKDVVEEMFPVIAGWEKENPKTGRMLPSRVVFSRECFETLRKEIQSAEYGLEVHHKQEVEEPLREELAKLREENRKLRQNLEGLEMKADVDQAMFRDSVGYLFDLALNPRCPTIQEFELAENIARYEANGDPLDIEDLQDLYQARGVDMIKVLVKGLEAS